MKISMSRPLLSAMSLLAFVVAMLANPAVAEIKVEMFKVNKEGKALQIGNVLIRENSDGLVFTPALRELAPGLHGVHVHENPDCSPEKKGSRIIPAGAAGDHLDPEGANHHDAPWADGHLGDLPALYVDSRGHADHPLFAPRLKIKDVTNRALIVHENRDDYADQPGGDRVACGIIGTTIIEKTVKLQI